MVIGTREANRCCSSQQSRSHSAWIRLSHAVPESQVCCHGSGGHGDGLEGTLTQEGIIFSLFLDLCMGMSLYQLTE